MKITCNAIMVKVDDQLTIYLEPGETHEHLTGGETEEGYDYSAEVYKRGDGPYAQRITLEITREARDCDGPLTTHTDLVWTPAAGLNKYGYPNWERQSSVQHDYFAEQAGY